MNIQFQLVAFTDAAGKYTPGAYLDGNEDNFYIDDDLSDEVQRRGKSAETIDLSASGMLMVVADGMGGMNAGEIASDIAVKTAKEFFTDKDITPEMAASYESRKNYMETVIKEADKRVKDDARKNPEHDGMGSTIIMAWVANGEVTVSWLGDSRAYRYNPEVGIQPLSKDHSYVQELVDKGIITYDQAFDHPQGNIIVRSLGDTSKKPVPESRNFTLSPNDIIILCSDGLSGVLRDRKGFDPETGMAYPEENIEDIVAANFDDISRCREELFAAAERGDWYDNVTVILCKIVTCDDIMPSLPNATEETTPSSATPITPNATAATNPVAEQQPAQPASKSLYLKITKSSVAYVVTGILVVIFAIVAGIYFLMNSGQTNNNNGSKDTVLVTDTVEVPATNAAEATADKNGNPKDLQKRIQQERLQNAAKGKNGNGGKSGNGTESGHQDIQLNPSRDPNE